MRTKILYEIETTSLMEALRTALEIQSSAKITPKAIAEGWEMTLFHELDARSVIEGTRSIEFYRHNHTVDKPTFRVIDAARDLEKWADSYFSPSSGHLNKFIPVAEAKRDFEINYGHEGTLSSIVFMRRLGLYARNHEHIDVMNPLEFCTVISEKPLGLNRILRRLRYDDGVPFGSPVDHIYMKSSMEGGASRHEIKPVLSDSEESD